mgnify:FL=1
MTILKAYRHTGIACKDINKSLEFYRDFLGMKVQQDFWDDSEYINDIHGFKNANIHMIKLTAPDGTMIELLDYSTHPTELINHNFFNVGICHIAFQVDNLDETYRFLKEKSVEFLSEPLLSSEGFAKVCFCFDPDNVRLELVEIVN